MPEESNEHLIKECMRIEEDSLYTGEAHYIIVSRVRKIGFWVKFIPAVVAAVSGILILAGLPNWVAWLAILSGAAFALQSILNPEQKENDHSMAAKEYTALKHEARALYQTFLQEMNRADLTLSVRILREKYNALVRHTPQTTVKAFEEGRKRIKAGRHTPDFEEKKLAHE